MRRLAMFGLICLVGVLGMTMTVIGAPAAGAVTNTPSFTSPGSNDHLGIVPVIYSLPDAVLPGSVHLIFTGTVSCSLTMTDASTANFILDTADLTNNAQVVSNTCGNTIVDGNYMVTIAYQNAAADPAATATTTNVEIDAVTAVPVVTTPASSTTYTHSLPLDYSLPEPPTAGSVRVTFTGAATCALTMTDATTVSSTLSTTSLLTSPGVASSTCGSSIPDGTYSVAISYRNSVGAPVATTLRSAVVIAAAVATTTSTTVGPSTSTTVAATTTTVSLMAPTFLAPTTTTPRGVGGTGLAATGSSTGAPSAVVGVGVAALGAGLLLLRRRRPAR